MKLTSIRN